MSDGPSPAMVEVVGPGSVVDVVDVVVVVVVGASVVVASVVGTSMVEDSVIAAMVDSGVDGGVVSVGFESLQPATTRRSEAKRTPPRTTVTAVR